MPWILVSVALAAFPAAATIALAARLGRVGAAAAARAVVAGFLAVMAAGGAELGLEALVPWAASEAAGLGPRLARAFAMVALVEEAAKLLVVRTFVLARPRPGGAAGAIAGAACVGAGFAFGESLLYGLRGSEALVLRAFTAAPAHAMFTGIAGAFLASSTPGGGGRLAWLAGLAWAVVLHGLYDALVASGPAAWLVAPLLLGCLVALARLLAAARRKDAAARNLPSYQRPRAPIV